MKEFFNKLFRMGLIVFLVVLGIRGGYEAAQYIHYTRYPYISMGSFVAIGFMMAAGALLGLLIGKKLFWKTKAKQE